MHITHKKTIDIRLFHIYRLSCHAATTNDQMKTRLNQFIVSLSAHIRMKIKRSVGILSKLRYYVNTDILCNLYCALIYPLLIYGMVSWENTYQTTLQPIIVLQKKALRIITFSKFQEPSSPLFNFFSSLKLVDLISLHTLILMYQYHNQLLPSTFDNFFTPVAQIHSYNTRSAARQTYYLPSIRTNYGKFNVI